MAKKKSGSAATKKTKAAVAKAFRGMDRKTGPTKKTRTVARIAANKNISRKAANKIRKSRQ